MVGGIWRQTRNLKVFPHPPFAGFNHDQPLRAEPFDRGSQFSGKCAGVSDVFDLTVVDSHALPPECIPKVPHGT